ncbi:hypothetical protein C8J57DRAFT_1219946 [Mycena rebaudengoi]|nr:hypothetical protein C8J57DRAFT_1219946 [Mycena rebaudengoi]
MPQFRYDRHLAAVLNIQSKSPSWFADFQQKLYTKIITTSNFAHLNLLLSQATAADDELDGIDFAALEASVSTTPTPRCSDRPRCRRRHRGPVETNFGFPDVATRPTTSPFCVSNHLEQGCGLVPTPFRNAPNMTSARLGGYSPTSVTLPWAQVTRISVSGYDLLAVADVLSAATSLVEFKAIHMRIYNEAPDDLPPLMNLQTLSFVDEFSLPDHYGDAQEVLLDALTAPALRLLTVSERQLGDNAISTITSSLGAVCNWVVRVQQFEELIFQNGYCSKVRGKEYE